MTSDARSIRSGRRAPQLGSIERRNLRNGLLFISPWLVGFLVLGVFPILYTFYLSLTRYSGIKEPIFIGTQNYERMVDRSAVLEGRLQHSLLHAAGGPDRGRRRDGPGARDEPAVREIAIYRAVFYLPVDPARLRDLVHLHHHAQPGIRAGQLAPCLRSACPSPNWLGDPAYTKLALVLIAQLGAGQYALSSWPA